MALAIDSSTPAFVAAASTSVTTASFTPPVGSLLVVACVGTPFSGNPNFVVTSTGLTFNGLTISNVAGQSTTQMFTAEVGAAGGSSRTVGLSVSGFASCGLKVWVVTGQHASQYLGAQNIGNTTSNAFNATITTDSANNWVFGCGAEFNDLGTPTTTDVGEGASGLSLSYLVVRKSAATASAGAETLNFDSPGTSAAAWAWSDVAIRPDTYTPPAIYKVSDRGSTQNLTSQSSTTVALSSGAAISTGNYLVARVAMDNSGTSGAAQSLSVSDTHSNSWTVTTAANRTQASAANDGSTCYIAYAKVTTGFSNGDNLTFTYGGNVTAKSIVVEEWTGIDSVTPLAVAATTATGGSTTPSISRTPTATPQLFYGALSVEGPTGDTFTQDSDTTDGTWQTLTRLSTTNGTAASNQTINGVAKFVSGTSAQTWNPTITNRDWAQVALVFAAASVSFTGTSAATQANQTSSASGQLGYSGTSAATQANQSASASGTVINPVTGSGADTQASQTSAAAGQLGYSGTAAVAQAANTSTAVGKLGYTGTAAASQANQAASAAGQLGYAGSAAATQANQTSSATGTFTGSGFAGSASAAQASQTSSAAGQLGYSGTSAATQAANTSTATGQLGCSGSSSTTQANQTASVSGQLGYTGTSATTQPAQTSSGTGTFTSLGAFTGTAATSQANQTSSATGKLGYSGTSTATQANQTPAATGTVVNPVTGTAVITQQAQASAVIGQLRYSGSASITETADTSTATGAWSPPISGSAAVTLANQVSAALGVFTPLVSYGTAHGAVGMVPTANAAPVGLPNSDGGILIAPSASAASMTVPSASGG